MKKYMDNDENKKNPSKNKNDKEYPEEYYS